MYRNEKGQLCALAVRCSGVAIPPFVNGLGTPIPFSLFTRQNVEGSLVESRFSARNLDFRVFFYADFFFWDR